MKQKFAQFMAGRYGVDALGKALNYLSLALLVLSLFWRWLFVPVAVLLFVQYFRIFSRNSARRMQENRQYLALAQKVKGWVQGFVGRLRQSKTHRFYRCPSCRQRIRVPRGKGKIRITCPKCRTQFEKKS